MGNRLIWWTVLSLAAGLAIVSCASDPEPTDPLGGCDACSDSSTPDASFRDGDVDSRALDSRGRDANADETAEGVDSRAFDSPSRDTSADESTGDVVDVSSENPTPPFDAAGDPAISSDATANDVSSDAKVDASDAPLLADAWDGADVDGGGPSDGGTSPLCSITSCSAGTKNCWGRCVPPTDPAYGCGAADCAPCALPHALATCGGAACAIAACEPGFDDCNHDPTDGCEADLSSPTSCASCVTQCVGPTPVCSPNGCTSACTPPLTLCADRCVDLSNDPYHCGACASDCNYTTLPANAPLAKAFATCSAGMCGCSCKATITLGSTSYSYCSDTTRDPNSCSACGQACPKPANGFTDCRASTCEASCQPGWSLCGNACVTTQTNAANCGSCGHACGADEVCAAGACTARQTLWLATGVTTAQNLVVDQGYVYWTDASATVARVPTSGGAAQPIRQGQAKPWGLAVDDSYVYWSNQLGGAIWRGAKDGSGSAETVTTATQPRDIALHLSNLYWTDASPDVSVVAKSGGAGTVAATPMYGTYPGSNVTLFDTPSGPFVRNYSSPRWFFYSVLGGWSGGVATGVGASNGGAAQYGANLYYNGGVGCSLAAMDASTGQAGGCLMETESGSGTNYPLAASGCGVFYSNRSLYLARVGVSYGIPVLDADVDRASIAGDFLYFHSTTDNAIGRLPLP